jgi:methionyl-tRNA formyltransferase
MRWILCGKNDVAVHALEQLVARGDQVWAIANHGDEGRDGWQRSFAGAARRLGVPCDQPAKINDSAFLERLAEFRATALISIQYDQILRGALFRRIGCPCLNLHFALLPRHRGVAPMAWAILSGDREAGVTLHHMVEDIDAGDVIAQRAVPIRPDQSARELYDRVSEAGKALFDECYPFPAALLGRSLAQDHGRASYHRQGDLDFSHRRVVWSRPADELHRWIRAMIFPPMQHPEIEWKGRLLCVERVAGEIRPAVDAPPGAVVAASAAGIDVAAQGGVLRVVAASDASGERSSNLDILARVAVGDRLT